MVAKFCIITMSFISAIRTTLSICMQFALSGHFDGDQSRRNGNDAITKDHDKTGNELAKDGGGRDISISHCGEGDNAPIDTSWNTGEAILPSFYEIHDRPHDNGDQENRKQEYSDLSPARRKRGLQYVCLADKAG